MADPSPPNTRCYRDLLAKPPHEVISIARDSVANGNLRNTAVTAIPYLQVGEEVKRSLLDELLKDHSPSVIKWAVDGLAILGGERSVQRLRDFYRETQDAAVGGETLKALATMSDPWIVPHCAEMLQSETDTGFTLAAQALERLGSAEALSLLSQLLLNPSITGLNKWLLAGLLGRHYVSAAEPFLIEAVEREEDDLLRPAHAAALANLKNRFGIRVVRDTVTAFDDDKVWVTLHIVHTFSDFRPEPGGDERKQILAWLEGKQKE